MRVSSPTNPLTDPSSWLEEALVAHEQLHALKREYEAVAARRRACVQGALAAGATQQQVADVLGISRAHLASSLLK